MMRMRLIAVMFGALWGGACAIPRDVAIQVPTADPGMGNIHTIWEERYRLLFARDQGPIVDRIERDPQVAARRYRNIAHLNTGFEELSSEGFILAKVKPVANDGGATQFVFRRRIPEGYRPTAAPMEFTGVYRLEPGAGGPPTYYVLDPIPSGYRIEIMTPEGAEKVITLWTGDVLNWRHENTEETIRLADDARSIVHTTTEVLPTGQRLPRPTIREALRVTD